MTEYRFYKESEVWYIDLPDFPGEKGELAMVLGADLMLDIISEGHNEVFLFISEDYFECANVLEITNDLTVGNYENLFFNGGQYYILKTYEGIGFDLKVWLCDVTEYVFNYFPEKIYFKKIER